MQVTVNFALSDTDLFVIAKQRGHDHRAPTKIEVEGWIGGLVLAELHSKAPDVEKRIEQRFIDESGNPNGPRR